LVLVLPAICPKSLLEHMVPLLLLGALLLLLPHLQLSDAPPQLLHILR
jgi:hypothetical protein